MSSHLYTINKINIRSAMLLTPLFGVHLKEKQIFFTKEKNRGVVKMKQDDQLQNYMFKLQYYMLKTRNIIQ